MPRMMADCRRFPSDSNCSLVIIGDEDEVLINKVSDETLGGEGAR